MMTGINKYGATDIDYPYDVLSLKHLIYTVSETRKTIGYLPGCLPAHLQPKCQCACCLLDSLVVAFFHTFLFFFPPSLNKKKIVSRFPYCHCLSAQIVAALGFLDCFVVPFFFTLFFFLFFLQIFLLSLFISTDCGSRIKPNAVMSQNCRQEQ